MEEMEMVNELEKLEKGMKWRGTLTGVIAVGWIAFLVAWLLVYAGDFDIYKNIAVVLGTLVLAIVVVMAVWMSAFAPFMKEAGEAMKGIKGLSWRFNLSIALVVGAIVAILGWLWFLALEFNGYQNLAVILLLIVWTLSALTVTWKTWDAKAAFGIPDDVDFEFHDICAEMMKGAEDLSVDDLECPVTTPS
jgi:hypothetical protein